MSSIRIIYKLIIFFIVEVLLFGCSSVPILSTSKILSTQVINEQYYYCESCNKPTELVYQEYQSLEPDDVPVPVIKPVVTADKYNKKDLKPKYKLQKKYAHKKYKQQKPKQCIEWR